MARPRAPQPVKLLCGLLSNDRDLLQRARQLLRKRFGTVDLRSEIWPFDQTDYYEAEMGSGLERRFVCFERPIPPDALPDIKLETNALEQQIADDCLLPDIARPVNIDPGYIDLSKLVLASTKDSGHRVYLARGIYAEVTLRYTHGKWVEHPWTYPDYRSSDCHTFFSEVRERLRLQRAEPARPAADKPDETP